MRATNFTLRSECSRERTQVSEWVGKRASVSSSERTWKKQLLCFSWMPRWRTKLPDTCGQRRVERGDMLAMALHRRTHDVCQVVDEVRNHHSIRSQLAPSFSWESSPPFHLVRCRGVGGGACPEFCLVSRTTQTHEKRNIRL